MGLQTLMRQFSIRLRMLGAIGVVLTLLMIVGGAGLWGMQRASGLSHEFASHAFEEVLTLSRLRDAMGDANRFEKDMLIQHESPEQVKRAHDSWMQALADARKQMAHLLEGEEDEDNVIVRRLQQEIDAYVAVVEPVMAQMAAGTLTSTTQADQALDKAHAGFAAMWDGLQKIEDIILGEARALQKRQQVASEQMDLWFGLALVLAVLIVIPTTLLNMQSICQPLEKAQELATAITQGDLTQRISLEGKDEMTHLMRALGGMQDALSRIVGEVRSTTDSIGVASAEIASGNQDLSNRTEQTASSLQQTASSLEQINGNVHQSAGAARQASQMAVANAEVAERGGRVVGQVVTTMEEINHSSKKISDIIGVIDGIAFQTNILALNAAVEAARAGEQGRGFAVVAAEVRSLAQRSAEAAKEIKNLIGASVDKVEAGTRLVAEAGSTIGEIVTNAEKVSAFISEITTAANEQSIGIGQVNTAVGELDQMTQQNAALVEESAAAAESLREQAARLSEVVHVFRLRSA